MLRARSDAATSSPMKLPPITDGAPGGLRRLDNRPAVGERPEVMHVGLIVARQIDPDRFRAGCDQQRIVPGSTHARRPRSPGQSCRGVSHARESASRHVFS